MDKKVLTTISIIAPVVIILGVIFYTQANRKAEEKSTASVVKETPITVNETEMETPTDEELIKEALVEKNDWDPNEISVTISKSDGTYATGGAGSNTPGPGGGIWFAKKVDGNWEIVWDGNGVVMCTDMIGYEDYPTELIPECYNQETGKMMTR